MFRLRGFVTLFGLLISQQASAYCLQEWVCISIQRQADGIDAVVRNERPYPVTLTLTAFTENLKPDDEDAKPVYEKTQVLKGYQSLLLMQLTRATEGKRFSFKYDFQWTPGNLNATHDNPRYLYPYAKGEYYPIVQGFGGKYSHSGASRFAVDFAMPEGTPVHAARGGTVIDLTKHYDRGGPSRWYAKFANFVTILHNDQTTGEYYHLRQNGVVVELGDTVKAGQLIGYSGNTGFSSTPHLHFAVYRAKSHGDFESLPFSFIAD